MRISGDCETAGRLRIEGKVTGDVSAGGLEVATSGTVDGDVTAREGADALEAIVIDGRVEGAVRATRVEIRRGGTVNGGVVADEAVVHGHVRGGVLARRRLALEDTAVVEGDVRARRLALKEGGQVNGNIQMGEQAAAELKPKASSRGKSGKSSEAGDADSASPVGAGALGSVGQGEGGEQAGAEASHH
jgi:cytoskeletal protein CcmA (bactofilin family)